MRTVIWAVGCLVLLAPLSGLAEEPATIEERWDFYFARINDAPASVLVNMALRAQAPLQAEPTLLYVLLDMKQPDEHRMGTPDEVKRMQRVEQDVTDALRSKMRARNVARIRGEGLWQLYYYAPNEKDLQAHVKKALTRHGGQTFQSGSKPDPQWKYYTGFLYPNAERLRWIKDRRIVDRLQEAGDVLVTPRAVEHFVYFPDEAKRKAFEAVILPKRFVINERVAVQDDKLPFLLRFHREDKVELEHIHAVAEFLRKAAAKLEGSYDGWVSAVVTTRPAKKK